MDGMLRQMSSRLLHEWMAFYNLEPFGAEFEFMGHAQTASVIAEANRDPKKRSEPFTLQDFMFNKDTEDSDDKPSVFERLKEYLKRAANVNRSEITRKPRT